MAALVVTLKSNNNNIIGAGRIVKLYPAIDPRNINDVIKESEAFIAKMSRVFNGTYTIAKVNSIGITKPVKTIQKRGK